MRDLRLLHQTCFCWRRAAISLQLTESHLTRTLSFGAGEGISVAPTSVRFQGIAVYQSEADL
jgi:hypothetical protein